jgi:hypothetical protein
MIMKCRDMESVMAPTSHRLLQGGMRTRDWFSDRLGERRVRGEVRACGPRHCNTPVLPVIAGLG